MWLGEPPIDWSKIKTSVDLTQLSQRDRYPAELIKNEILGKRKKTLVIYGGFHLFGLNSLKTIVEQSYAGSFFVVSVYTGFPSHESSEAFERNIELWRNRLIGAEGQKANTLLVRTQGLGMPGDAVLYVGPAAGLTESPVTPDLYLDPAFRSEINRRSLIIGGRRLPKTMPSTAPTYIHKSP